MPDHQPSINTSFETEIDLACDAFEAAWRSGAVQGLDDLRRYHPGGAKSLSGLALTSLVAVDLEYRWKIGQGRPLEEYIAIYPELGSGDGIPIDLVRVEWRCRQACGDSPSLEEYRQRFPHVDVSQFQTRGEIETNADTDVAETLMAETAEIVPSSSASSAEGTEVEETAQFELPSSSRSPLTQPRDVLLRSLAEQGLISTEQANELEQSRPNLFNSDNDSDATASIAQELVRRRWLNEFQADALVTGVPALLVLGEYVITEKIGQGGMGQVYRAVHRRMQREVALKVLTTDVLDDTDAVKRFRREVETVSRLDHPNIVGAHDADAIGDIHYYVMELVDGDDLAEHVKQHGPMGARKAVSCILDAARGLEYAHGEGIVHRDIKPHNLLLDKNGTVKVLDLGLARLERQDDETGTEGLTGTGNMMGTVDFMAPEQALDSRSADARSDIYSLGCTLYYLLTGRPLFEGDSFMQKLLAHRSEPAPSIALSFSEGADALESVYQRMLAKDPDDRPQTMDAVIAELEPCLEALPEDLSVVDLVDDGLDATAIHLPSQLASRSIVGRVLQGLRSSSLSSLLVGAAAVGLLWFGYGILSGMLFPSATLVLDLQDHDLAGADVLLDGELMASIDESSGTPSLTVPADGSEHTLEVKREGFKPFSETIKFDSSVTAILPVPLVDLGTPPPNYALRFDGQQSHVVIPTLMIDGIDSVTIELTVTPDSPGRAHQDLIGAHHVNADTPSSGFAMSVSGSGKARIGLGATGARESRHGSVHWADVHSLEPLVPLASVHMAFVFENGVQSLYLDGHLQESQVVGEFRTSQQNIVVGASRDPSDNIVLHFDGVLDELRVSRIARYGESFLPEAYLPADDQTLALYHFDKGSGDVLIDASGNGHDGQIVGAEWVKVADVGTEGDITSRILQRRAEHGAIPQWAQNPQYNHAIQFDGDGDFLEVPTLLLGDMRPFTLEAWVNPDDVARLGTVFSTACTDRMPPQGLKLALDEGRFSGLVHGTDSQGNAFASVTGSGTQSNSLGDLKDVHVAFCFDGASQHLYMNGQLVDSRRVLGARPSMTPLFIGADNKGDSYWRQPLSFLAGRLDEIRISRGRRYEDSFVPERRLNSDESTLALFHLDCGAGDVAFDSSGNSHHANIINARWIRHVDGGPIRGPLMARSPFDATEARALQESWAEYLGVPVEFENSIGMKMQLIPAGKYMLGSTDQDRTWALENYHPYRYQIAHERGPHRVVVHSPFYLGEYELQQSEYAKIMGANPSVFSRKGSKAATLKTANTDNFPVDSMSWSETVKFCNQLTHRESGEYLIRDHESPVGIQQFSAYRVPTASEWEVAARAGTITRFPTGNEPGALPSMAAKLTSTGSFSPVGQLSGNAFGLFDTPGKCCRALYRGFA